MVASQMWEIESITKTSCVARSRARTASRAWVMLLVYSTSKSNANGWTPRSGRLRLPAVVSRNGVGTGVCCLRSCGVAREQLLEGEGPVAVDLAKREAHPAPERGTVERERVVLPAFAAQVRPGGQRGAKGRGQQLAAVPLGEPLRVHADYDRLVAKGEELRATARASRRKRSSWVPGSAAAWHVGQWRSRQEL